MRVREMMKKLLAYVLSYALLTGAFLPVEVSAAQTASLGSGSMATDGSPDDALGDFWGSRGRSWSSDYMEFTWSLTSTENIDGIEVAAEDRDGVETILATLGPTATKYSITEKLGTYRRITLAYYRLDGTRKIYGEPWTVENPSFGKYLLQDGVVGVQHHTKAEIRQMWKKLSPKSIKDKYSSKPKNKAPYKAGSVASSTLKNGVNTLNFIRYVAGVSANVKIKNSYQSLAQAAALVNYNDKTAWISHFPNKPKGMDSELYKRGYEGSSSSNLYAASGSILSCSLYDAIAGWMSDSDSSNIDRVGHRRWCINPPMKYTGFGIDSENNSFIYSMYAFDRSGGGSDIHGVGWPAQNTPLNFFGNADAWSISMGCQVPKSGTKVVLTRKRDRKTWTFTTKNSKKNGNYMNIDNGGYGQTGCIIFRPKNIQYKNGDSFQVKVSGKDFSFSYDVNFFSLGSNGKKTISKLRLDSFRKNGKKIVGTTIGSATVRVEVNKKTYTVKSAKSGRFTVKLGKKLKSKDKIKVSVSKNKYAAKTKTFRVK